MFPYSFGVQAPTKEAASAALVQQTDELADKHPDHAERYGAHLKAVHDAAGALLDLLPDDDEDNPSDVAISAAGHLTTKKNPDTDEDDVQSASVHISADRRPTDVSKHPKKVKKAPASARAVQTDAAPPNGAPDPTADNPPAA
jgi:hypothetical protein